MGERILDWKDSETDVQNPPGGRLWEESWDDDDTTEDFSTQLRFIPFIFCLNWFEWANAFARECIGKGSKRIPPNK